MNKIASVWLIVSAIAVATASTAKCDEAKFSLSAIGGAAVSPDGVTLVVSLTSKAELLYIDTVAGKEGKRVELEFQPTLVAWGDKVLFVAQKGSGIIHVIDPMTGKELASGKTESPPRNFAVVKGICFASSVNRQVYAIDPKGDTTKTEAEGTFISAPTKGDFVYTLVDGRATTDVYKYRVDGKKLKKETEFFRSLRASLVNVQGMQVTADGKAFGVVAGGGWADSDNKRHYGVPLYSTEDMKSQLGELETGAYPCGFAVHPEKSILFGCNGKDGKIYNGKSYVELAKFTSPKEVQGASSPSVLLFVAKGKKLAWGVSSGDNGTLTLFDVPEKK